MKTHHAVKHPNFFLTEPEMSHLRKLNEQLLDYIADHVLPSTLLADIALTIPLLVINAPDSLKLILAVFSGSWIQWWALHILQRSNVKADRKHEAKVMADHMALTHVANTLDEIKAQLSKEATK